MIPPGVGVAPPLGGSLHTLATEKCEEFDDFIDDRYADSIVSYIEKNNYKHTEL